MDPEASEVGVRRLVERALQLGVNAFDTAPSYGHPRLSERRLGEALDGIPDVHVMTKVGRYLDESGIYFDYSRDATLRSIDESRRLLGRDTIDLVHIHDVSPADEGAAFFEDDSTLATLLECKKEGLVSHIGVSGSELQPLRTAICQEGVDSIMLWKRWTLLDRSGEATLSDAESRGVGVIVAAPFASGVLAAGANSSATYNYGEIDDRTDRRVRDLEDLCARYECDLSALALQFAADRRVTSVMTGADDASQVERNVNGISRSLPDAVKLEAARI
jgi:D-threo-aldose 1-dehydrogenase